MASGLHHRWDGGDQGRGGGTLQVASVDLSVEPRGGVKVGKRRPGAFLALSREMKQ